MSRCATLALAAVVLGACAEPPAPAPSGDARLAGHDCLVIILDALSADHLGSHGAKRDTSPRIDGLAESGVRFDQAWSQTSWTLASTASLMTGLFQESHGVRKKDQRLGVRDVTLAEAFGEVGYETHGFSQNPFASSAFGMARGFTSFEDLYLEERGRTDEWLTDRVIATLGDDPAAREPRFVYAHYRRPHAPYDPPAEIAALFTDPGYRGPITGSDSDLAAHNSGARSIGVTDRRQLRGLYDAGILTIDGELGRLFDGIDLSRTLIVVLSDHGEAFGRHGAFGHNTQSFEPMVNVPLIVSHPELAQGRVVDQPVMSIDLFPTLADLFGLDASDSNMQGDSFTSRLLPDADAPVAGDADRPVFTSSREFGNNSQMQAVLVGDLKLLRMRNRTMLYDLANDPREQKDIATNRPSQIRDLVAVLDAWEDRQLDGEASTAELDAAVERELRALGYMGGELKEDEPADAEPADADPADEGR